MSKELIERLREAAAQRVASTAMIGAEDLIAAAYALESMEAAYTSAMEACKALTKQAFKAEQERDALARELTDAVDDLAQHIRQIDGNHSMGAGELAESIAEWADRYLKGEEE